MLHEAARPQGSSGVPDRSKGADLQSAGQLVRLEPRTLAVVVATTGRLRADVAGNRTFFYRVHQRLRCLLTRAGSAFEVLVEEVDDPCAGVAGGRLVEA